MNSCPNFRIKRGPMNYLKSVATIFQLSLTLPSLFEFVKCQLQSDGGIDEVLTSNLKFNDGLGWNPAVNSQQTLMNVIGTVFSIRSTTNATVDITGFEFYSSYNATIFYDLYTKEGSYYYGNDTESLFNTSYFQRISSGVLSASDTCSDQSSPCSLIVVPMEDFEDSATSVYTYNLTGIGSTRSFYISLGSNNLGTILGDPSFPVDKRIIANTSELELFEGLGGNTYPFDPQYTENIPVGFIGKVWYRIQRSSALTESPSLTPSYFPSNISTVQPSLSPSGISTGSPTVYRVNVSNNATNASAVDQPPANIESIIPTSSSLPTETPTLSSSPSVKPTFKRCRPDRPCPKNQDVEPMTISKRSPPPGPPKAQSMMFDAIGILEDVPNRDMKEREVDKYCDVITKFLQQDKELIVYGVNVTTTSVFHHYVMEKPKRNKRPLKNSTGIAKDSKKLRFRRVLNEDDPDRAFIYTYNTQSDIVPKTYPAAVVMTEFGLTSPLPFDISTFFVWNQLNRNQQSLLKFFSDNAVFVTYLRSMSNVSFQMYDELTIPPSPFPTKAVILVETEEITVDAGGVKFSFAAYAGFAFGFLWCTLTGCSVRYIVNHREQFKQSHKLTSSKKSSTAEQGKPELLRSNSIFWKAVDTVKTGQAVKKSFFRSSLRQTSSLSEKSDKDGEVNPIISSNSKTKSKSDNFLLKVTFDCKKDGEALLPPELNGSSSRTQNEKIVTSHII